MRWFCFLVVIFGFGVPTFSQTGLLGHAPARVLAMGGAGVALRGQEAVLLNPAGLVPNTARGALATAESRFGLAELSAYSFGAVLPSSSGTWGLSLQHFGGNTYREQILGLAYGRQLSPTLQLGLQLGYGILNLSEYGQRGQIQAAVGVQAELLPALTLAALVRNPVRQEWLPEEYSAAVLSLGLGYQPNTQFLLLADVAKDINYPVSVRVGFEYHPVSALWVRGGISTGPESWSLGLGVPLLEVFQLDVAARYHPYLGFSPTLTFAFRQKKT